MSPEASTADTKAARIREVRAVLFDLDGTLLDTIALILASMRHATEEILGVSLTDEELMRNVGIPLWDQMELFSADHKDELVAAYRVHNRAAHDESVREYPGVDETLRWLADQGYPMGVVTSKSRMIACRGMDLFSMREYFGAIVCADDVEIHKPDPHPLRVAADTLGVPLEHCIYVGDSPFDMRAAIDGGAVSVAALWGAFTADDVLGPGPDFALPEMSALRGLLDGETERYVVRRDASGRYTDEER